jgi:hypothetical protein
VINRSSRYILTGERSLVEMPDEKQHLTRASMFDVEADIEITHNDYVAHCSDIDCRKVYKNVSNVCSVY